MKKLTALLLALLLTVFATGCRFISDFRSMLNDLKELSGYKDYGVDDHGNLTYVFNDEVIQTIDDRFTKLEEMWICFLIYKRNPPRIKPTKFTKLWRRFLIY